MKLEDQVCSLELAKRLKELGVKQESYFKWNNTGGIEDRLFSEDQWDEYAEGRTNCADGIMVSAFTVAELLFKLPRGFAVGSQFFKTNFECFPIFPAATNDDEAAQLEKFQKVPFDEEGNPANVAAKMLIYLIENNLVKP